MLNWCKGFSVGLEGNDIHTCVTWMQPYAVVLNQKGPVVQKMFKGVSTELCPWSALPIYNAVVQVIPQDSHNIQNHDISMMMFEDAVEMRKRQEIVQITPFLPPDCSLLMTPPRQPERRSLAPMNVSCWYQFIVIHFQFFLVCVCVCDTLFSSPKEGVYIVKWLDLFFCIFIALLFVHVASQQWIIVNTPV